MSWHNKDHVRVKYQHNRAFSAPYERRLRRRRRAIKLFVLLILLGICFIVIDIYRSRSRPAISQVHQSVIEGPKTFRSTYFQFDDYGDWAPLASNSTPTKFYFYKRQGKLVEHELIVYVNEEPPNLTASRALPITISVDGHFSPQDLTDHCQTKYGPNELHKPHPVSIGNTVVPCDPETPQFSVIFGQVGSNYVLNLKRPNGQTAKYIVVYRDLTVDPTTRTLLQIAKSFRTL